MKYVFEVWGVLMFLCRVMLLFLVCVCSTKIFADEHLLAKPQVQEFIQDLVIKDHFSAWQLRQTLRQAKFQPLIIQKMDMPYESKPWDIYQSLFLTPLKIDLGVQFWNAHRDVLSAAERKYGVPGSIIVGILGVETIYGRQQGGFRVLDALTTLAFYYPKRAAYFLYELRQYLLMCREYHLDPLQQMGSYAGAMGQSQFMPSSYRRWAVSYQGRGAPDIVHNTNDAIFSVANYLSQHGWSNNEKIVQKLNKKSADCQDLQMNLKQATYLYRDVVRCGFKPTEFHWSHPSKVGVLELLLTNGYDYWMGYPNFYVILTYNSSPLYGLAVYLLGNAIASKV